MVKWLKKKWNCNSQQFINQQHFNVTGSTQGVRGLDQLSEQFSQHCQLPSSVCAMLTLCNLFQTRFVNSSEQRLCLAVTGILLGPPGFDCSIVIIIIIINKTTALINVLHNLSCAAGWRGEHSCVFYRSYKHRTRLPRVVVWAEFLEDLMLVFPAATIRGGLPLPDPGRHEHYCPWDVQMPDVLRSSVFTPQREGSCSSVVKVISYKINKCPWGGSVSTNELGWKSKLGVQTFEQWLEPRVVHRQSWIL